MADFAERLKEIMDIKGLKQVDVIKLCERNIGNKYLTPNKKIKILVNDKKIFFIAQD